MIKKIPAKDRYYNDFGGLKTHWLFSFGDYQDINNTEFGTLRVFNDDIIMPGVGFPEHFHDTYEIVTIVLDGELSHKDSMGNEEVIKAGEMQRISAGNGIKHSEFNHGKNPVHLYQIWFYPNEEVVPGYEQKVIKNIESVDLFKKLTSDGSIKNTITLHSDSSISLINLKKEQNIKYEINKGSGLFLYITKGSLRLNNEIFLAGDQARIVDEKVLKFNTDKSVEAILIKVKL